MLLYPTSLYQWVAKVDSELNDKTRRIIPVTEIISITTLLLKGTTEDGSVLGGLDSLYCGNE